MFGKIVNQLCWFKKESLKPERNFRAYKIEISTIIDWIYKSIILNNSINMQAKVCDVNFIWSIYIVGVK